jgi:hypothetical protein
MFIRGSTDARRVRTVSYGTYGIGRAVLTWLDESEVDLGAGRNASMIRLDAAFDDPRGGAARCRPFAEMIPRCYTVDDVVPDAAIVRIGSDQAAARQGS